MASEIPCNNPVFPSLPKQIPRELGGLDEEMERGLERALEAVADQLAISVVIPFWGRTEEMEPALAALAAQTLSDFEVVVVADGCALDEAALAVLRERGLPTRVVLLDENRGPFWARAIGGATARGRYVWFLDHDDSVEPEFLERMLWRARTTSADVVECPLSVVSAGAPPRRFKRFADACVLEGAEILQSYLRGKSHNNLANKLIRRSLWKSTMEQLQAMGLQAHDRLIFFEDMICTVVLYQLAERYASTLEIDYVYVQRDDSTTNKRETAVVEANLMSMETVLHLLRPLLLEHGDTSSLAAFQNREVKWSLEHLLLERVQRSLSPAGWERVDRIQRIPGPELSGAGVPIESGRTPVSAAAVTALLRTVTGREARRVMVVAAHPDDEIVGVGAMLAVLPGAMVVHASNGVPADPRYASWAGFDNATAYGQARDTEARQVIKRLGLPPQRLLQLGLEDQQLSHQLVPLTHALAAEIAKHQPDLLIVHPYEGGHPDHDAVAFACHHVFPLLERWGVPLPGLVEMTSYFSQDGKRVVGDFATASSSVASIELGEEARAYKRELYGCYTSQEHLLATFPVEVERLRMAPKYDFNQPPQVPEILYDRYDLGTSSSQWLELTREASQRLETEVSRMQPFRNNRPAVGEVDFGDLGRIEPVSRVFGYDRGTPIDRPFIETFLHQHRQDIRGRVLEIGDNSYTRQFGGEQVSQSDVLHVKEGAPGATIIGDLSNAPQIPDAIFDCLILTQVLVVIFDLPSTIATIHRILKPGGVALITVPGISNIDKDEWRKQWMWSFTPLSLRLLLQTQFKAEGITVSSRGNVLTSIAFLQGLCAEDLQGFPPAEDDPLFPQTVLGRAVK